MFLTDKLAYIALPKTGSTQIHRLLADAVGGARIGGLNYHATLPARDIPWFVVGSIRNPWDWYVSTWAYNCARLDPPAALSLRAADGFARHPWLSLRYRTWREGKADDVAGFRRWLLLGERANAVRLPHPQSMTRRFLKVYARGFIRAPQRLPDDVEGFYRERCIPADFIRQEGLEADVARVLALAGHEVSAPRRLYQPRSNVTPHRPTVEYYDHELIELIAERDAFIISEFGYQPPA